MTQFSIGSQAPWFTAPALSGNQNYNFSSVAGRAVLLLFAGSAGQPACTQALAAIQAKRALFDDLNACFFGVTVDSDDASQGRIAQRLPGIRWFLDYDHQISTAYGAMEKLEGGQWRYQPGLLLLDHRLRVAGWFRLGDVEQALAATAALAARGFEVTHAPVLVVPRVFEPELCRHLIDVYEQTGGTDSGFMREIDGMTVPIVDHQFKRRSDHVIEDERLQAAIRQRLAAHLLPEIERAYAYRVTHIERWMVARYGSEEGGGFFNRHRDNTTRGTAHRRFACTINLNTEDYEGGDLSFPEYGPARYRAPTGGAVIFSCSLLHEAHPVTRGTRYAFLPFLYDEAAADLREANKVYLSAG